MEMDALASSVTKPRLRKFAVVGSGPLPLTSICLSRLLSGQGGAFVHNIDRDPWAISQSFQLCTRLGYTLEQMRFQCADVHNQPLDLYGCDVVYLAGLVGVNEEDKQDAINKIARQMSPGALLVLRSAHSLRGLLYPVSSVTRFILDTESLLTALQIVNLGTNLTSLGLKMLLVVHPCNHIINSVVVCQIQSPV